MAESLHQGLNMLHVGLYDGIEVVLSGALSVLDLLVWPGQKTTCLLFTHMHKVHICIV